MINAAMAFAWVGGTLFSVTTVFTTTTVEDGICRSYHVWHSPAAQRVYTVAVSLCFFFLPSSKF